MSALKKQFLKETIARYRESMEQYRETAVSKKRFVESVCQDWHIPVNVGGFSPLYWTHQIELFWDGEISEETLTDFLENNPTGF
jgi:hypothetical protein